MAHQTRSRWILLFALSSSAFACNKQEPGQRPAGLSPGGGEPAARSELLLDHDFGRGAAPPAPAEPEELPAAPSARESITGTIVLPPARRAGVAKGDTIFIAARKPGAFPGPGSLLAAQRLVVDQFPLSFALSARDAMVPGTAFEGTVNIIVRVDKDGDPLTRQRGDVYGQATNVKVGRAGLVVSLDTVQKDDVTLAGGPLVDPSQMPPGVDRAGLPPGHP